MKKNLQKDNNMGNLTESKLVALLKNSKAIMNKVEENTYSRGNIDPSMLVSEGEMVETPVQLNNMVNTQSLSRPNTSGTKFKNLNNTKLPKQIVEAMVNNPIEIPETPFHTFDITENLVKEVNSNGFYQEEYEEKPIPKKLTETKRPIQRQSINQNSDSIRDIIREEISNLLPGIIAEYFDNRVVTEQIQVKVGNTLFSGNLKPLPSKQSKK